MNQPLPTCLSDFKTQFDELCGDADKIIEKYKKKNMNREIKFRAYEDETARGRMFQWDEIKSGFILYMNCRDTFLMQFTGLKDKRGVEIYEGDIIKYKDYSNGAHLVGGEQPTRTAAISISDMLRGTKPYGLARWDEEDIEVIGNIHEHPELLK